MDYFGRLEAIAEQKLVREMFQSFWVNGLLWKAKIVAKMPLIILRFQSFWVNGLLWKMTDFYRVTKIKTVSILLGQWITLEDTRFYWAQKDTFGFNPSGSMDYFGRNCKAFS